MKKQNDEKADVTQKLSLMEQQLQRLHQVPAGPKILRDQGQQTEDYDTEKTKKSKNRTKASNSRLNSQIVTMNTVYEEMEPIIQKDTARQESVKRRVNSKSRSSNSQNYSKNSKGVTLSEFGTEKTNKRKKSGRRGP